MYSSMAFQIAMAYNQTWALLVIAIDSSFVKPDAVSSDAISGVSSGSTSTSNAANSSYP